MKDALLICAIFVFLSTNIAPAQPDRPGRMDGGEKTTSPLPGRLLTPQLSALYPIMGRASDLLRRATDLSGDGLNTGQWHEMSEIFRDISGVVGEISRIIDMGYVVRQEKEALEKRISDIEKRLEGLREK